MIKEFLPETEYIAKTTSKMTIVLHHTSGSSAQSAIEWWRRDTRRVGTHYIIERNGQVYHVVPEEYWLYQGLAPEGKKSSHIRKLESQAIGIELVAWGHLDEYGKSWAGTVVPKERRVSLLPNWRGHQWFERYTPAQLKSLRELVLEIASRHRIALLTDKTALDIFKNTRDKVFLKNFVKYFFFEMNKYAIEGGMGLWGHCTYTTKKTDPFPQTELIDLIVDLYQVSVNL